MKVTYHAAFYPVRSADGGGGDWLTDGKAYTVLEVGADPEGRNWFRVEADNGTPGLFDTRCFALVDGAISARWRADLLDNGTLTFSPPEFLHPGFWEAFFDRDARAEAVYAKVVGHPRRWS